MATSFIMLTRLAHGAPRSPEALERLEQDVKARIDQEVGRGGIEWLANYVVLEPYGYLDIFRAPDVESGGDRAHLRPCSHRSVGRDRVATVQGAVRHIPAAGG